MKKIYIEPKTEMIVVKTTGMIAGSPGIHEQYSEQPECSRRLSNYDWDED